MEKQRLTDNVVCANIESFVEAHTGEFYDVDMLVFSITHHPWSKLYKEDPDDQVEFMCGVMLAIRDLPVYELLGAPGCVILFNELNSWAEKYFDYYERGADDCSKSTSDIAPAGHCNAYYDGWHDQLMERLHK